MRQGLFKANKTINALSLFVILLISCKVFAAQTLNNNDFDEFVNKVETLKDVNPGEAYRYLNSHAKHLMSLSIANQLIYYKLLAEIYLEQAQYQKSYDTANIGLKLAKQLSSPSIIASELLYARGFAFESLGDYDKARADYLNGLEIADSLNDKKISAMGLINIGALDYLIEKFDRSLVMFNDALAIAQQLDDDELSGFIYSELGILYSLINQEDKSLLYYQQSYEHYLKSGKIYYAYNTLRNIASNYSIDEQYEKAISLYKEIIQHAAQISNNELLAYTYSGMAWAQVKQEDSDPESAYQYMLIASQYAENAQQADFPISHALDKGYLFMELSRFDEALESLIKAAELLKQYDNSQEKVVSTISKLNVYYLKAELYFKLENYKKACQAQDEFLAFALSLADKSNADAVEDLRMRYESEQADLQKKILEQQQSLQSIVLSETNDSVKNSQLLMTLFGLIALVLAWLLAKTIRDQRKLLRVSRTDSLTGLANRRWLMQRGKTQCKHAKHNGYPYSLLMIDVDNFKQINDVHGHEIGDQVLKQIASIGEVIKPEQGVFARFGGEEFVMLLPDTDHQKACRIAEQLRQQVNDHKWHIAELSNVSLSTGVASTAASVVGFSQLLKQGDERLYKAKEQGKNRVCGDDEN